MRSSVLRHVRRSWKDLVDYFYLVRTEGPRRAWRMYQLDRSPVFIVGCGRSGTTLLLAILGAHPRIVAVPSESEAFLPGRGFRGKRRIWSQLDGTSIPAEARRWAEKTPRHVRHIRRILYRYGRGARVLIIVRDGRDVVTSFHPKDPNRYWVPPHRWVEDVEAGLAWAGHPQVLTIRYEDLVSQPAATVRAICGFVGEEFSPAMLEFAPFPRSEGEYVEYPPNPSSIGRWRSLHGDAAVDALLAEPRAVALLQHYAYPMDA